MAMDLNLLSGGSNVGNQMKLNEAVQNLKKKEDKLLEKASAVENSEKTEKGAAEAAAAQEASKDSFQKSEGATSRTSVMKMSAEERKTLVTQLKEEQEVQNRQFLEMISKNITGQAGSFASAHAKPSMSDDGIWKFLASGNYTVDAETKQKAQEAISENGYYGVKQTSQRLFDFAAAMAGDDEKKMKEYQSYVEEGFRQAEKSWGQKLPGISYDTKEATAKLFDEYYKSKQENAE